MLHSYILYKAKKSISLLKRFLLPWMIVYIIQGVFIFWGIEYLIYVSYYITYYIVILKCDNGGNFT